ncbi:hypothetical protein JCM10213_009304 [Rhodosporidiobolus nylandii]
MPPPSASPSLTSPPLSPTSPSSAATSPRSHSFKNLFRRSRSRPELAPVVVASPRTPTIDEDEPSEDLRPQSPSVVLSPASPDFPPIGLPPLPDQQPTELVPARVLPLPDAKEQKGGAKMDKTLRHSLALLDERLAEIQHLGGVQSPSWMGESEPVEEEERLASDTDSVEEGKTRLAELMMGSAPGTSRLGAKDVSLNSLSSFTSGTSSEDAFDIADFPSLDHLGSSFGLTAPLAASNSSAAGSNGRRSSDLMTFPVPPSLPNIPLRRPSAPALEVEHAEELVFEQLAELGQGDEMQGLGLFSTGTAQAGRSRASSSASSQTDFSGVSGRSFDASTMNTSWGHREKDEEPFPPELNNTLPLFSGTATSRTSVRPLPQPINPLLANMGSAHPALASPFVEGGSFAAPSLSDIGRSRANSLAPLSPTGSVHSPSSRALPSPTNTHFSGAPSPTSRTSSHAGSATRSRANSSADSPASSVGRDSPARSASRNSGFGGYFAPMNRLGDFDGLGIPYWVGQSQPGSPTLASPMAASPAAGDEEEQEELLEDPQPLVRESAGYDHIRMVEPVVPPSPSAYQHQPQQPSSAPSSPSFSSGFSTLRRLSSFGLLKKRKSEGVLGSSGGKENFSPQSASSPRFGGLSKRKSEAALSNLLRSSKNSASSAATTAQQADKENTPTQAAPQLKTLSRRSVSTPKLNKLFGSPTSPSLAPTSPTGTASPSSRDLPGFSARPRTLSFGEAGEEASGSTGRSGGKNRFSTMIFGGANPGAKDQHGEMIPPLPPTPKEHLPPSPSFPSPRSVAKSATSSPKRAPPPAIDIAKANRLDTTQPGEVRSKASPAPTLEISASATPSSAAGSMVFSSTAESSPAESAFPATPVSSVFAGANPSIGARASMTTEDMSLAAFLKATDPDQQMIVKRPARTSSFFQPSSIFPPPSSSSGRSGSPSSRPATPLDLDLLAAGEETTSWHRPTSPALLEALKGAIAANPLAVAPGLDKQVFRPQEVVAFPVRVPATSLPPTANGTPGDSDGESSGTDDYGEGTGSSDEDDKPLGVVVPGALTAQKSLRMSAAKQRRSERTAQEKKDKEMRELAQRTSNLMRAGTKKEDPFELEQTAAMVATPAMSVDGHGDSFAAPPSRLSRPALSPIHSVGTHPSCSTITSLQSGGHDSLLPQTDAHIERRAGAGATGMKRSPSMPLDPMIAESSLTMDSPVLRQEPLPRSPAAAAAAASAPVRPSMPMQQSSSRSGGGRPRATSRAALAASPPQISPPGEAPPIPTMRPPPAPPSAAQPPLGRRPSLHPEDSHPSITRRPSLHPQQSSRSTSSPASSPSSTPQLGRRPSLHPDPQGAAMTRQFSSSSGKSSANSSDGQGLGMNLVRRPTLGARGRSGTVSSAPAVEHKVFLDAAYSQSLTVQVSERTLAGEVVAFAKGKGALGKPSNPKEALEGGWALWEVWRSIGLERPIREYELVTDVVKSWDNESNVLVFRRTPLWPILSSSARIHPCMPRTGPVQLDVKKGKWSKRFLELKEGTISYSKSEKGKDAVSLCVLSNFDVFFVSSQAAENLKAPKGYGVFALKSRLTRAHYEEKSEWCHFLCVKTADEMQGWVKTIMEAGNAVARAREQAVLGTNLTATPASSSLSGPLIPSSAFPPAEDAPPVPSIPSVTTAALTPAAAIAAAARNASRPAPPILQQRSNTLPLGGTAAGAAASASLSRNKTVVKPTTREWGAMGQGEKHAWTKESERIAKGAKQPLVDLSGR